MPIRYLKVVDTATHEEHLIDTGGVPVTDATPTQGSTNPVSSGGVHTALAGKQNTLTFDSTPTSRSSNPVSSGGVYTALQAKQDSVPYTSCSTEANVAAKEAWTSAGNFVLAVGARILVSFSYQNTASNPTLNVDETGAKEIYFKESKITNGNEIALVGGLILLVYDGYNWNIVGNYLNTLNTAGASDFSNHKLYPVGALYPYNETITYSNSNIYFGSDNEVYSNGKKVAHADVEGGIAIVSNGNTHAAITAGQYVYVKDHSTLSEGLYKAASAIAANATLSTSNLTACSNGGMNDLKSEIASQNNKIGNTALPTTAQTLTGAIAEHEQDITSQNNNIAKLQNELGIVCNGNKCTVSATTGQYIILKNSTISGCADGLYTATQAIPANTAITSAYLSAVPNGGLNALNDRLTVRSQLTTLTITMSTIQVNKGGVICYQGTGIISWPNGAHPLAVIPITANKNSGQIRLNMEVNAEQTMLLGYGSESTGEYPATALLLYTV